MSETETGHKRRRSQKRMGLALAASRMGIWEWDALTDRVYCSPECFEIIGMTNKRPGLESFLQRLHPDDKERVLVAARQAVNDRAAFKSEFRIVRSDGEVRWLYNLSKAEHDGHCLVGVLQDITSRKQAEEQLQASVRAWDDTFNALNDAISVMDETGAVQWRNRAMVELHARYADGFSRDGRWKDVQGDGEPLTHCPFSRMRASRRRESAIVRHSGRWFSMTADPLIDRSDRLVGGVQIVSDITEYKQSEEKLLNESESRFTGLAEQPLAGIYIFQDDAFQYVNARLADMFGYGREEFVISLAPEDLVTGKDRDRLGSVIRRCVSGKEREIRAEFAGLKKSGDGIYIEVFGSRAPYRGRPSVIGIILDITEKKKLELQLRQAQKMESVGRLTSGIAHDFNNILSAIIGYASLLQIRIGEDVQGRNFADNILSSADRASTLIRSLLTFSRKQVTDLQPIDINATIRRAGKLIHWVLGGKIELRVKLAPRLLAVNGDPGQIEQVLLNLAANAADAMPEGGTLSIETSLEESGGAENVPEPYAVISVTDTGTGMDEKTREKIFEPFFTTKDQGQGTGLGLSMVSGIIEQHKGYIRCTTRPGAGTNFRIGLPLLQAGLGEVRSEGTAAATEHPRGTETLLVAEDDETMMTVIKAMLEAFGYKVIEAPYGKSVIERFVQHKDRISLVLCDVMMPGKSGAEIERAVRAQAPDMPILFMSCHDGESGRGKSPVDEKATIIFKPFPPGLLLKKIRDLLDGKRDG